MNLTLRGFLKKEFRQSLRDPQLRAVLFGAPIFQLILFGVALSNEVKNIRLAAVYAPSDQIAREVHDRAIASGWFVRPDKLEGHDPYEWLRSGQADAAIVTSGEPLEKGGSAARLQLLINSTNVLRAQAVENYMQAITAEVGAGLSGAGAGAAGVPKMPIDFDIRILYNPMLITSWFMVPGVMGLLLAIVTMIMTSMSIAREREVGTLETLISAPVERWEVILGKSIPFIILGFVQLLIILAAAVAVFHVPFRGPLLVVLIAGLFYIVATVAIGVLISTISKNQQQAMLGGFLFLFPAILFSGLMFPLENMPFALSWIATINPVAHFTFLMRNILLKGGDPGFVIYHICALGLITVVLVVISFRRFQTRLG